MIEPIPPARIPHEWDRLGRELARCKKYDDSLNLNNLLVELCQNRRQAWRVPGGYVLTELEREVGSMKHTFWITHVVGKLGSDKRRKIKTLLHEFEEVARTGRCGQLVGIKSSEIAAWAAEPFLRFLDGYTSKPLMNGLYEVRKKLDG